MSNAIEHFSRHRVGDTTLQVMADTRRNLSGLIEEEQSVIRHYARLGVWPHKRVNMFVFEDLQPLDPSAFVDALFVPEARAAS